MITLLATLWMGTAAAQPTFSGSGDQLQLGGIAMAPEYYVVQPGDTLWEISSKFLGNPYYWPRLWSINDEITNPHWIYPGNRIVFRMGTEIEPPGVELESSGPSRDGYVVESLAYAEKAYECGPDIHFTSARPTDQYSAPAILAEDDDFETYGTVYKARSQGSMLADGDLIYLEVEDPDAFQCGDHVALYRRMQKKVKHPADSGEEYGSLYRVVGEAVVVHHSGDMLSARITDSWVEIARGDLVGPTIPVSVELEVRQPEGDLRGTIVARMGQEETWLASNGEVVFLDRGREDGVRVGNTFWVVEQRDEYADPLEEDSRLPESVIGRVVVVRVDDRQATAVVVESNRSIATGAVVAQALD